LHSGTKTESIQRNQMRAIELYETRLEIGFELLQKFKSMDEIGEFAGKIQEDCSDFLSIRGTGWLYRATDDIGNQIGIASPTPDRPPLHTPREEHNNAVHWMKKNGAIARRDNSFFCYNNPYDTENFDHVYGNRIYSVVPINGFHYTWFDGVNDFTMQGPKAGRYDTMDEFAKDHPIHVDEGLSHALSNPDNSPEILIQGRCYFIQESIFEDMFKDKL